MSSFPTATKNARADAVTAQAGTGAKLQIFDTGYTTKLIEFTWTGNVWAAASAGALTMNAPATNPVNGLAAGTAAIGRLTKADGTTVVYQDFSVGTSASEIIVSTTTISVGLPCQLNSFTITEA